MKGLVLQAELIEMLEEDRRRKQDIEERLNALLDDIDAALCSNPTPGEEKALWRARCDALMRKHLI